MSLRCHFDEDGWLQGPVKIVHLTQLTPNRYDSGFAVKARGMVQHTEDGFEAGTVATFLDPHAQASAFFSVAEDGTAHQYLPVGHGYVAWAQEHGNPDWRSCEFEDKTRTGDPMTQPQLVTGAQILEALSTYDGFPLAATDDPVNGRGVITHGDGGPGWGNHPNCPGNVRKAQRPKLIALAIAIRQEANVTGRPAVREWVTAGQDSLAQLAAAHKTTPAVILQLTVTHSGGVLPAAVAGLVNGLAGGTADPAGPMPKGLALYLPT